MDKETILRIKRAARGKKLVASNDDLRAKQLFRLEGLGGVPCAYSKPDA